MANIKLITNPRGEIKTRRIDLVQVRKRGRYNQNHKIPYSYHVAIPKALVIALNWRKRDEIVISLTENNELVLQNSDFFEEYYSEEKKANVRIGVKLQETRRILRSNPTSSFHINIPFPIITALSWKKGDLLTYRIEKGFKLIYRLENDHIDYDLEGDKPG